MNNEIKVMNNDEIRDFCIKKDLKIFELEQELQQKENIIKEVREYIINHREAVDERAEHIIYFLKDDFDEEDILKILDDEKV